MRDAVQWKDPAGTSDECLLLEMRWQARCWDDALTTIPARYVASLMPVWLRILVATVGNAYWAIGAIAILGSDNEVGSASLVLVGALTVVIAMAGRLPSRLQVSGNQMIWDEVRDVVEDQIAEASADGDRDAVEELVTLRARLERLEHTGRLPDRSASMYDRDVVAALRRVTPSGTDVKPFAQHDQGADSVVRRDGRSVFVETKWLRNEGSQFKGSTLEGVVSGLPSGSRLVVVTNARHVELAEARLRELLGHRGRVVSWRGPKDDAALSAALQASGLLS